MRLWTKLAVAAAGLAALGCIGMPASAAPIIANGSFQSGGLTPGWLTLSNSVMEVSTGGVDGDGFYDRIASGGLYQTFATLPGQRYEVSFAWASGGRTRSELGAAVDSGATATASGLTTLAKLLTSPDFMVQGQPALGVQQEVFDFVASGAFSTLLFGVKNAFPDRFAFGLDAVEVAALPEPGTLAVFGLALGGVVFAMARGGGGLRRAAVTRR